LTLKKWLSMLLLVCLLWSVPTVCSAETQEKTYRISETQLTMLEQNSVELKNRVELLEKMLEMSGQNFDNLLPMFNELIQRSKELETKLQLADSKSATVEKNLVELNLSLMRMTEYINKLEQQAITAVKKAKPNWEIRTGIGQHDNKYYLPFAIQRNYSRYGAVGLELHLDSDTITSRKINGYEFSFSLLI
jgi:hypothetical protein